MRKIRAIDIAKSLGVSKASVSLALNNKPGISDDLRSRILECKKTLEQEDDLKAEHITSSIKPQIKLLVVNPQNNHNSEIPVDMNSLSVIEEECSKLDYDCSILFSDSQDLKKKLKEVEKDERTAGILVFATELLEEDLASFKDISLPVLALDHDMNGQYSSCILDNYDIGKDAVKQFRSFSKEPIVYLKHSNSIYNFRKREEGYASGIRKFDGFQGAVLYFETGSHIQTMIENIKQYFKDHPKTKNFICENNQIAAAMVQAAFLSDKILGKDIHVISFDQLPGYFSGNNDFACYQLDHQYRMKAAVNLLNSLIENPTNTILQLKTSSAFIKGSSLI